MIYQWYKIFNLTEFKAKCLASYTYTVELEALGQYDILVTKGKYVSLIFEGVLLPVNFNSKNPFEFLDHAVYLMDATQDVYLGLKVV